MTTNNWYLYFSDVPIILEVCLPEYPPSYFQPLLGYPT